MANLGYIQVTRDCRQKCRFCSNPPSGKHTDLERCHTLVDDLVARSYDGVILTGGEPTLMDWLPELVAYARDRGLYVRMITNAQRLGNEPTFTARLAAAGLKHVHISQHSYRPDIHDFITQTPGSHDAQTAALEQLGPLGVQADINCVINRWNADHLHLNVRWLVERWPFIRHFVWNNLDPNMNRCLENPDVIHRLSDCEASLHKAMRWLDANGRTFRVERMPLCYMAEFAHCSTETRKIVKGEQRVMHFLDQKGTVVQDAFRHGKAPVCQVCSLDSICGGLYSMDHAYSSEELYPLFLDPEPIRARIHGERTAHRAPAGARPTARPAPPQVPEAVAD